MYQLTSVDLAHHEIFQVKEGKDGILMFWTVNLCDSYYLE